MNFTDEDVKKLNNLIDERFKLVELRLYNHYVQATQKSLPWNQPIKLNSKKSYN